MVDNHQSPTSIESKSRVPIQPPPYLTFLGSKTFGYVQYGVNLPMDEDELLVNIATFRKEI